MKKPRLVFVEARGARQPSLVRCFRNCITGRVRLLATLLLVLAVEVEAEPLPDRRPALIGSSADSLVNLIDTEQLMQKGQRDAWVMFDCVIGSDGRVGGTVSYRVSPDADLLKREVSRKLKRAKFIPAIYKHRPTHAGISGTAVFVIKNGRPHLRVYENQELDELKRGSDFIAPQVVTMPGSYFPGHAAYLGLDGVVKLRHSVDAEGNTTRIEVLGESPTGEGFGASAQGRIRNSHFLPAYRNGRPVASVITFDYRFFGRAYTED